MEKYRTDHRKVYLMCFRKDGKVYIKPGVTDYKDVFSRIEANRLYEPQSRPDRVLWVEYFDSVYPLKSITVKGKELALKIEQELLKALGDRDAHFDVNFSGITEVRKFTPQRFATATDVIEKYRVNYNNNKK